MLNPSKSLRAPPCRWVPFALLLLASANPHAQQPMSISPSGAAKVPPQTASSKRPPSDAVSQTARNRLAAPARARQSDAQNTRILTTRMYVNLHSGLVPEW